MVELVGDICIPTEFRLPLIPTASLPSAPAIGTLVYDSTTNTVKVWTGSAYETLAFVSE